MIPYILNAGVILAGCLIFYKILLQKETFFRLNRWMLFICLVISFSLPLIPVPQQLSFRKAAPAVVLPDPVIVTYNETTPSQAVQPVPAQPSVHSSAQPVEKKQPISLSQVITWAGWLYWFGVAAFGFSFLLQLVVLLYQAYTRPVIKDGRLRIVELSGDKAPCSFGNIIFINPEKYDYETYSQILLHEKIHVQQGHSFDIILAEIVLILQWFNPFAWLYRKELMNNLEFLTDDQVLHHPEVEKDVYQLSLVKVSAPHFPLNITTNYNQSLLKKRVAMMNAKKSNVHTAWKYFFLLPLLVLMVCLLNEPVAAEQLKNANNSKNVRHSDGIDTEGYWFATIKEDQLSIQFKNDEDDNSNNSSTFPLSDIKDLPRDKSGVFSINREAGTIEFTGRFEGKQGMGRYKFIANKTYSESMSREGITLSDKDLMIFFMVNVKGNYLKMLKDHGYTNLKKDDVIPLAALKVDAAFIEDMKKSFGSNISVHNLIPLKALEISKEYVEEIRKAGYPNMSPDKIIAFKSQGIDGKYIADVRESRANDKGDKGDKGEKGEKGEKRERPEQQERPERPEQREIDEVSADDIVALKALNVTEEYIRSLQSVGYDKISNSNLVAMKAQHITADYIRTLQAAGYKHIDASELIAIKAQNVTPEFVKGFESVGINIDRLEEGIALKALDVTPEFVKSFQDAGFKNITIEQAVALRSQHITPADIKEYKDLGFDYISADNIVAAKATGTTPAFIKSMKAKGHNLKNIDKYIQLKTAID